MVRPVQRLATVLVLAAITCGCVDETATQRRIRDATIVVSAEATPSEQHAAEELRTFLEQVTGVLLPISDAPATNRVDLLVGPGAAKLVAPDFLIDSLGTDGIVLQDVGQDLILAGGRPRGTLYAVYTFLEDAVGVHWWSPEVTHVPRNADLQIPSLKIRYVPPFEYRQALWRGSYNEDWAVRNRVHGVHHPPIAERRGGSFHHSIFCHTFFLQIPPDTYFADHPEWFSEISGKRVKTGQLCLTNEEMREEMVRVLLAFLAERPEVEYLWVSQNDWGGPCTCVACAAVDEEEGTQAGSMLRFVNAVADEIAKVHPNIKVATLAYQYTRLAPRKTRPRKNVVVWLCAHECNFTQPFDHASNDYTYPNFKAWAAITDRLYFWDYTANFWSVQTPHPNWFTLGPNVKLLRGLGVKGVFAQGAGPKATAEMSELRGWVLAKHMWNPDLDADALIRQFLDGYYGAAGKPIYKYLKTLSDEARSKNFYASLKYSASGGRHSYGPLANVDARCISLDALAHAWAHLVDAEAAVMDDAQRRRVDLARAPLMILIHARWDELLATATEQGKPWTLGDDKAALQKRIQAIVGTP